MATPNGEYRSARKTPNRSAVIVSQYIAEPDLRKRSGAGAGGPNTGDRGFGKFSCIKLQPLAVQSDKVSSLAKTSPMDKPKRRARFISFISVEATEKSANEARVTTDCAHAVG